MKFRVLLLLAAMVASVFSFASPASADSGKKCTTTTYTQTCIFIYGTGDYVSDITATHRNYNPDTVNGRFRLTNETNGLTFAWSPLVSYKGSDVSYEFKFNRYFTEGKYCVQFYRGTSTTSTQTGKGCATVHS